MCPVGERIEEGKPEMCSLDAIRCVLSRSVRPCVRRFSSGAKEVQAVTLIEGDGIGPEISKAVVETFEASGVFIIWDSLDIDDNEVHRCQ